MLLTLHKENLLLALQNMEEV